MSWDDKDVAGELPTEQTWSDADVVAEPTVRPTTSTKKATPVANAPDEESFNFMDYMVPVGLVEAAANMGSGMFAKTASDIAGLSYIPVHALGLTKRDPDEVKRQVQQDLTYSPKTASGKWIAEYNPLALLGKGLDMGADWATEGIESNPLRSGSKEFLLQLANLAATRAGAGSPYTTKQAALDIQKSRNAPADAILAGTRKTGYKILPSEANPTSTMASLEGLVDTRKLASDIERHNQNIAQNVVRQELGLPDTTPLSAATLKEIGDTRVSPAYEAVGKTGQIPLSQSFMDAMKNIADEVQSAMGQSTTLARGKKAKAIAEEMMGNTSLDASMLTKTLSDLRTLKSKAISGEKKDMAAYNYYSRIEKAIELEVENHLSSQSSSTAALLRGPALKLFQDYKAARELGAKTHAVRDAMDGDMFEIDPTVLGEAQAGGAPLTGGLESMAHAGRQYPHSMTKPINTPHGPTALDRSAVMAGALHGAPLWAAVPGVSYGLRKFMLSDLGQRLASRPPSYKASRYPIVRGATAYGLQGPYAEEEYE